MDPIRSPFDETAGYICHYEVLEALLMRIGVADAAFTVRSIPDEETDTVALPELDICVIDPGP